MKLLEIFYGKIGKLVFVGSSDGTVRVTDSGNAKTLAQSLAAQMQARGFTVVVRPMSDAERAMAKAFAEMRAARPCTRMPRRRPERLNGLFG